jgi:multicomponent Na+:H+ antiporter subunit D
VNALIPLAAAVPMIAAGLLVAFSAKIPRSIADAIAVATSGGVLVVTVLILRASLGGRIVYWFGGWHPVYGFALGISWVSDAFAAGAAALASVLTLAALVFSWRYFDVVGTLFHALMLIFMAAMVAFSLTGDLFNLFVFFELMSVAAYSLTGYKVEDESALEGAINFAITNSIAGFFILIGIGLLYSRAGVLNMAQLGRELNGAGPDALVLGALTFLMVGYLIKGAIVPFHLWLADAHAVAPTPVCVLFSGVMVELGLYAALRVYWTIFAGIPGLTTALHPVLVGFGVATALIGAILCLFQRHLKRLLAFSTISHMGLLTIGGGALSTMGLAGAGVYAIGHGLVKGALFICAGIVLNESGSIDELELIRQKVGSPLLITIYTGAALGLAGMPPFPTAFGKDLIEGAFSSNAAKLVEAVMIFSSAVTGAAVLRAGGRIFFGWGQMPGEEGTAPTALRTEAEAPRARNLLPSVMILPAAALVVLALIAGLAPHLTRQAEGASILMQDRVAYAAEVLDNHSAPPVEVTNSLPASWTGGFISTGLAILLALFELFGGRHPMRVPSITEPAVRMLRAIHSGRVGDYVAWIVTGFTIFAAMVAAQLFG